MYYGFFFLTIYTHIYVYVYIDNIHIDTSSFGLLNHLSFFSFHSPQHELEANEQDSSSDMLQRYKFGSTVGIHYFTHTAFWRLLSFLVSAFRTQHNIKHKIPNRNTIKLRIRLHNSQAVKSVRKTLRKLWDFNQLRKQMSNNQHAQFCQIWNPFGYDYQKSNSKYSPLSHLIEVSVQIQRCCIHVLERKVNNISPLSVS